MTPANKAIIIRAAQGTLSFLTIETDGKATFHPYAVKNGMSLSANLRTAFHEESFLQDDSYKAHLLVVSPVLLIPKEEYDGEENFDADTIYGNTITGHKGEAKVIIEIPELNAVSIFPVNTDLQMVVNDHYKYSITQNVMTSVWQHLYREYYRNDGGRRLFVYFHDRIMDICCFEQHRFRFANSFNGQHAHDALYYTLFVWKQLGMRQQEDELFLFGDMPHQEWLETRLRTYVRNVKIMASKAASKQEPFDLTLCE